MARRAQSSGSVYPRKDGRFAASASFEGKRITKYGKTKKEAWDKLQTALDDLKAGRVVVGPSQTVKQYLEYWLESVHRLEIELTSLDQYRVVLRVHLIPAFGHFQLKQLRQEMIQEFYIKKIDEGLSPRRIHFIHAVFNAALRHAVSHDLLAKNPCDYVTLPKRKRHKPRVLSMEECKLLLIAIRNHHLWYLILLALTTGIRIGELCALHWEDFDVEHRRIHIHRNCARVKGLGIIEKQPKSESGSRQVVLTQAVLDGIEEQKKYIAELRERCRIPWRDLDLVFPNNYGSYLDQNHLRRRLRKVFIDAGFEPRKPHDLRHSAATLLFAAGLSAKVVQEALGHSNIAITLGLYGDVLPDMQQRVADVMEDLF